MGMTAEFFNEVCWTAATLFHKRHMKPGEFYNSLSENTKEKLKSLKSDDLNKLRLDEVLPMIAPSDKKCMSDLLLDFDKKVSEVRSGIRYQNLE